MNEQGTAAARYAGREMREIFSDDMKFRTWRRLWLALAEAEASLGLPVSEAQLAEMQEKLDDVNYGFAAIKERELRHDVAAHIHAFAAQCPKARSIIGLGASESFVSENGELVRLRAGMMRVRSLLVNAVASLADFAERYRGLPCRAGGAPQTRPVTLGKRACLWIEELLRDLDAVEYELSGLRLLGCRGNNGTAESFLVACGNDADKAMRLEQVVAEKLGFPGCYPVSGRHYSRKVDMRLLQALAGCAVSCLHFANDMRRLCSLGEIDAPLPSLERLGSLARFVLAAAGAPAAVLAGECLEQPPEDDAYRRVTLPDAFLASDGMLAMLIHCVESSVVYPRVIAAHLTQELPFFAEEPLARLLAHRGLDRDRARELVRRHAAETAAVMRSRGTENDMLQRLAADPACRVTLEEMAEALRKENFTGLAQQQTEAFLYQVVDPLLAQHKRLLGLDLHLDE